jgi:hypothetical protein
LCVVLPLASSDTHIVGIALIVVGFLFVFLALVAAARKVLQRSRKPSSAGVGPIDPESWAHLLGAATAFVKTAPEWLLLAVVGAGLIGWGGSML